MAQGTEAEDGNGAPQKAAGKGGGGEVPAAGEEVVMRAPVHCDGCGRKLRRSLERLDWVGEVSVDSSTDTVVVRGPKVVENAAETVKIVERRTGGKAVLVSPPPETKLPPPPPVTKETKKDDGNDLPETNMKMVVILRMNLHCDACCEEIKRRILRIKGVEDAVPHLKSSQMMVKGVVEPATLVGFIRSCTGRKAAIFRAEPLDPPPPPAAAAAGQAAETKKEDAPADDTGEKKKDAQDDNGKEEEEAPREEKKGGGGDHREDSKEEKPADGGRGRGAEEHEHEEARGGGEGEKHAAGRLFAAPLPAGVFTVAPPPEMTMGGAISNVTPYHHHYSYPPSAASYYYPYYAHPSHYQCQYPQPYYYPPAPYMYGYYPQPAEAFTEENPNSCAIV